MLKDRLTKTKTLIEESGAISLQILDLLEQAIEHKDSSYCVKVKGELEDALNCYELKITQHCIHTLALFQPEAKYLRFIISSMQINNALERLGDVAVNIAKRIEKAFSTTLYCQSTLLKMLQSTRDMLAEALESYHTADMEIANNVFAKDDIIDDLRDVILNEMIAEMKKDESDVDAALRVIVSAQNIERIGDLTTIIGKNVIYMVSGVLTEH